MRAAIYTRISKDPSGLGAGVARQEADCRKFASERGIHVQAVFTDNDTSAYRSTPRPGYQALLRAIAAHEIDAVLVWHTDRLYRRMTDLEGYITVCQPLQVPTLAVQAGPLDLSTPSGRMVARQLGAVAQYESEQKAERQRAANRHRAQQGKHFGTRRCFGYELDGLTLRQAEADAIRDAYRAVLDGTSLASIARTWNALGFRTPQAGNDWNSEVLGRTLKNARLAGFRSYQRSILYRDDGQPVRGEWPAVVDEELWHAVQSILAEPGRRFPAQARGLLSGIALCSVCGSTVLSGGTRKGRRRYRCRLMGGHVYREAEPIDNLVNDVMLRYLSRPEIQNDLLPPSTRNDAYAIRILLAEEQKRSDGLVAAFADGVITPQQLRAGQERIAARRIELEGQLPRPASPTLARLAAAASPTDVWEVLDTDERRSVINDLLEIRLKPTGGKEHAYLDWRNRIINPDSLELRWKPAPKDVPVGARNKRRLSPDAVARLTPDI